MEYLAELDLLDTRGNPLSPRIAGVLRHLTPRFRREFPAIQDEVAQTDIFEEAGRRLTQREQRGGPLEKLTGYAWVTVRSVAQSYLRLGSSQLLQHTADFDTTHSVVAGLYTETATPEQIERGILLQQLQALLSPAEQFVWQYKLHGHSSREIARHRHSSVSAVDTLFCRAKSKLRQNTRVQQVLGRSALTVSRPATTKEQRKTRPWRPTATTTAPQRHSP